MEYKFSYDEVTYPTMIFQDIRPSSIGAVAILHGVMPDAIENCRVLELGCGDGATLLSTAFSMPDAECVGLDLSRSRIEDATRYAGEIGIGNATFHHLDVMDYDPESFGKFDFIIAHGLFSWVPDFVREKILFLYRESLKPNGIGYISYNALPGWHMRRIIRDAMRFQTELGEDSIQKTDSGIRFIEFLAEASRPGSAYKALLENELESLRQAKKEVIFHDDLSEENQPFFFKEFNNRIESAGLQFVSESDPIAFFTGLYPEFARIALDKLWNDPIRREQYFDFIRGTRFRSSLVCLPSASPSYVPLVDSVESLYLSSRAFALDPNANLSDESPVAFFATDDSNFSTNHRLTKTALGVLSSRWAQRLSYMELAEILRSEFEPLELADFNRESIEFKKHIVELIHANIIEASCFRPRFCSSPKEKPEVSAFARWQAKIGAPYLTNINGANVSIENEFVRAATVLLDGSRTVAELETDLLKLVQVPSDESEAFERSIPDLVESTIGTMRRNALFVS
ncbi:MAG TPA: class I SAM-dependent methyltransferase [Pyrinomonadaceae bacterium]